MDVLGRRNLEILAPSGISGADSFRENAVTPVIPVTGLPGLDFFGDFGVLGRRILEILASSGLEFGDF